MRFICLPAAAALVCGVVAAEEFHFTAGIPDSGPAASSTWWIDWDDDGRHDLLQVGITADAAKGDVDPAPEAVVGWRRNIGSPGQPRFAPLERLRAADGDHLSLSSAGRGLSPADWDGDGTPELVGLDGDFLVICHNTGQRDEMGWLLEQPRRAGPQPASRFREELPALGRKRLTTAIGARLVDWEGDGDLDLLSAISLFNVLEPAAGENAPRLGHCLTIFEISRASGRDESAMPVFDRPQVVLEDRGVPLHASGAALGGPAYLDWDADGDADLLFYDLSDRPEEPGRLMFAENDGTRDEPRFVKPIPILAIAGAPVVADWNEDGRFDLLAGGQFFENINPNSGSGLTILAARRRSGTRVPHHHTFPKLVPRFVEEALP